MDEKEQSLEEILGIEITKERVERLRQWTKFDIPGLTPEVEEFLFRQFAQQVNVQYARFLAGVRFTEAEIDDLMAGAIDIHAHGGSEPFERLMLEDDLAIDYTRAQMRAVVIKTWYTPSVSHLPLVRKALDRYCEQHHLSHQARLFGGVTLNYSVGGLNPEAVKRCLGFPGFRYIWMPMVDSYHHRRVVMDQLDQGIQLLDERGRVVPPLKEILKIAADNDLVVACGHYPYRPDGMALMEEAKKAGVRHTEFVHPTHIHSKLTIEEMKEAAREGVKLMLMGLGSCCFPIHETGPIYAVRMLREVGADHIVYGSDLGQIHNPAHVMVTRWFIKLLIADGATKEEIRKAFQETPARHLGLEAQ
ncbi:MAG: amidohydrolase family protein [Deltaproteobacteria bacterium]|nr:amidohydrolase family protein [Deltaproteobacteria bacterium]